MPAVSEAQRRALFAKFGAAWVHEHHFDNPGPLPMHAHKKKRKRRHLASLLTAKQPT